MPAYSHARLRYARTVAPSLLSPLLDVERNATAVATALSVAVVALNDCARTKRDADAAFATACGPFLGGLATLIALQWAALLAVVAARPCWNAVRFARWHDARVRSAVRERAAQRRLGRGRGSGPSPSSDAVASETSQRAAATRIQEVRGAEERSIDDTVPVSPALIEADASAASVSARAVSAVVPSNLYSYAGRGSVYSPSPSSSSPSSGVFGSPVGTPLHRTHAHALTATNQSPLLAAADAAVGVRDDGVYVSALRSSPPALSDAPTALRDRRGQ